MISPGLVSVTFRQLSVEEVAELASQAGLAGIEWGGDIHVPHGDLAQARRVRDLTLSAGLEVASYGSYYRVWPQEPAPFDTVLETALALGAPTIRVWSGKTGSLQTTPEDRALLVAEARRISEMAAQEGISVALEFHANTLTDSDASAVDLLKQADHPNLKCYWQPRVTASSDENLASLRAISSWLHHIHVFHWQVEPLKDGRPQNKRLPLEAGRSQWQRYLASVRSVPGQRYAMLEFVRDEAIQAFREDAAVLLDLCASV